MKICRRGQIFVPVYRNKKQRIKGQFGRGSRILKSEPDRNVIDGKVTGISNTLCVTDRRHSMPQATTNRKHGDYLKKKVFLCI
jgi:hypothetical protein